MFVIPILPYKLEHEAFVTERELRKSAAEESKKLSISLDDPSDIVQNGILHEEETIEYEPKVRLIVEPEESKSEIEEEVGVSVTVTTTSAENEPGTYTKPDDENSSSSQR